MPVMSGPLLLLGLALPAAAVEPDETLTPLTPAALRVFVTQHEYRLKACLREAFDDAPSTLTVSLTVSGPPEGGPPADAPLRGDLQPDPWVRTLEIVASPDAPAGLDACLREPIEYFFRNVSLAHDEPRGTVRAEVVYRDLNARTPAHAERAATAERTVRARLGERQPALDRCLTDRDPKRFSGELELLALGDGAINLQRIRGRGAGWDLEDCVAGALSVDRQRVGDRAAEPFILPISLTRPAEPRRWRMPEPPEEPH